MFFKKQKKISASTLIDLKHYIDRFFYPQTTRKELHRLEEAPLAKDRVFSAPLKKQNIPPVIEEDTAAAPPLSAPAIEEDAAAAPPLSAPATEKDAAVPPPLSAPATEKDAAVPPPLSAPYSKPSPPSVYAPQAVPKAAPRKSILFGKTKTAAYAPSLQDALGQIDESFSEMLLRKIDEKHLTDAQCYKKAQIDRKLFSKIRSQRDYRPCKPTAISFALALELSLTETHDLLLKAGYALSHSNKADIIVEYFIIHGIYDKFLVNEALYEFDQPLL